MYHFVTVNSNAMLLNCFCLSRFLSFSLVLMALVEHHSLVYLNMLGSKGFVVAVVSLVIALQLLVSRKASCVNCYKQWGYKMH